MSKRKPKKRGKSSFRKRSLWKRQPAVDLEEMFDRADNLIERGRAQEAIALLEPLLASYPRVAELHYYLGYARIKAGDFWTGILGYERAMELSRETSYWLPLASLYLQLGLNVHALNAFRQVLKHQLEVPEIDHVREAVASLEKDVAEAARQQDVSIATMEKGLRYMEEAQRAMQAGDFKACIVANRKAIKLVDNWPPPHNNLSIALFFVGQPQEAITAARQVLSAEPDNIQALSNSIRFLAWTGQESEARQLWPRLQKTTPYGYTECLKKAQAAAILDEDESVYQILKPLDKPDPMLLTEVPGTSEQIQIFLAIAEANTGKRHSAQRRLQTLSQKTSQIGDLLSALQTGQPGLGWAKRFPYFPSTELMTGSNMEEFMALVRRQEKMSAKKFRREMVGFVARFPQIILVAEKLIWEENKPEAGIAMLATLATPAAYAALRRFALSQVGDDQIRMQALVKLREADQITGNETFRMWIKGEWQEIQLRQYEISDEPDIVYTQKVADLLNQGLKLLQQNKDEQAERLFRQALKLEPRAKEACNNLAAIYARRGEHKQAKEMFQAAIEIDPTYVFPRANLVLYLLDEDDIEGAEAMLAPLADETQFQPQEMAFYAFAQARLLIHKEEYEAARHSLEMTLQIIPDYKPAQELLDRLDLTTRFRTGWESFMEKQRKQNQAKRARLQGKLSTPQPSLSEALPLYSKDALTATARIVIRWGGWSGLRKAELLQQIIEELNDRDNLERIVAKLNDDERDALRQVLADGGSMIWQEFDTRYGNDLEESPYWQYHLPETLMGRLRLRGLLAEATVDNQLLIVVPAELRRTLGEILA